MKLRVLRDTQKHYLYAFFISDILQLIKKYFNGVLYECSYNDITVVQFMAFYNLFLIWNSDASKDDYDDGRIGWLHNSLIINVNDHEVGKLWRWQWMAIGAFKARTSIKIWKQICEKIFGNRWIKSGVFYDAKRNISCTKSLQLRLCVNFANL